MAGKKKEWLLVALILLITFLVFSPVTKYGFVNWDDDVNVTQNRDVQHLDAASIKAIFTHTVIGGYTPLTTLSFAIENKVFGMNPGVFHFNNLLLHLLCTLLVYLFFRQLGAGLFVSLIVTVLFGIHPMRVESVAWITERKDVLYSFFFLLSANFYLRFYQSKRRLFYALALLAFALSLLAKIQAVTLPLVLWLIDYHYEKKFRAGQGLNKIPFFLLSLLTGIAGVYFLGHAGFLETNTVLPLVQRIFIGTYTLCVYLVKSVVPYRMSAIYPSPDQLSALFYASILPVILLAVLIIRSKKNRNDLVFGSLFFLFNVMFMLQVVGAGQAFLADRFTYIAYIGLFFLMARLVEYLYTTRWKIPVSVVGALYIAALGVFAWNHTKVWKDSGALFSDVIRKYPESSLAHNNLGLYYRDQKQNDKAIQCYSRSIELNPLAFRSYNNRGEVYFERGEIDKALSDMNRVIQLRSDYGKGYSNRGAIHGSRKEFGLALADLDRAIELDPMEITAYQNRLLVHYAMGNYEKASVDATSYLDLKPGDANVINQRGLCYDHMGLDQKALADFNQAIRINPSNGVYYENRSYLYTKMGNAGNALKDILKARELGVKINMAYLQKLQSL
jgi:tetratricopeptide (TPR) repeat protein